MAFYCSQNEFSVVTVVRFVSRSRDCGTTTPGQVVRNLSRRDAKNAEAWRVVRILFASLPRQGRGMKRIGVELGWKT